MKVKLFCYIPSFFFFGGESVATLAQQLDEQTKNEAMNGQGTMSYKLRISM